MQPAGSGGANAAAAAETMQPPPAQSNLQKPAPQQLNVIQKTFRAEALARFQRATHGRLRFRRAAGGVLVQPLLHLRQQGRAGADSGRRVRARGDPAACARPLRRHAAGGGAASGDAVLPRQPAIARAELARRHQPQARTERKSRARNPGAAHARRRRRLHARTTSPRSRASSPAGPMSAGRGGSASPAPFVFNANAHEPGAHRVLGKIYEAPAWRRARPRCRISRAIPRRRNSSPPNSSGISSPTIRRRRWSRGCRHFHENRRRSAGDDAGAARCRRGLEGAADENPLALRSP